MTLRTTILAGALTLVGTSAFASCAFENETEISILATGFEAWKVVTGAMADCGNVAAELSQTANEKQPDALGAEPSLYQLAGVHNSGLVPLVNQDLVRPLDDLIAQYGGSIRQNQLISQNGEVVAIAMMVNAQHLMYRDDILSDLGLDVPETYEDILAAAEVIQEAGVVDYPLGGSWQTTWLEFVNMYLGFGGAFFDDDLMPTINNDEGRATLEMMTALMTYMDPEVLVSDSTYVQQQFQQGRVAMANFWASRAAAMDNPEESSVVGKVQFASAPRPTADAPRPASTLWWDGIVVAKNISDDEAEAAFRVAVEGMDAEMANANPTTAIWLIDGYEPGDNAIGAVATAENGALPYPASAQMGLMQTAIANNIADYLTGRTDEDATLAAIESDYLVSAREAGLVE